MDINYQIQMIIRKRIIYIFKNNLKKKWDNNLYYVIPAYRYNGNSNFNFRIS
jgi:hypothetical protein